MAPWFQPIVSLSDKLLATLIVYRSLHVAPFPVTSTELLVRPRARQNAGSAQHLP